MNKIEKLKFSEKLGFGSFSTASNIVYQFKSMYYLFFLTNVLHISMATAGILLSAGIVWDAVNDPLVGYYSVNHRFKNGERVRPFALWYAVPWAVTTVLIFTNFHVNDTMTIVIASVAYFAFELMNTFTAIPYNSMGSLATNNDADRRSINISRNIGGCVGTAIGAVACMPLLKLFGALDAKGNLIDAAGSRGFFLAASVMGVICIIGCLIHYFTTKERVEPENDSDEHIGMIEAFKVMYSYKPFVMNTLYILVYGIINLLIMSCLTYYCTYVMGSTAAVTPIQAVYLLMSLLTSAVAGAIDRKLGRKKTMLLAAVFYVLGKVWFIFDPYSMGAIYVNAITMGVASAITFIMFNTNRNNLSDLIEWHGGRRMDGMIGTADNLATKLGEALAAQMMTGALAYFGFSTKTAVQSASAVNAINAMLGWVPALLGVIMFVIILFMDIDKDMEKMNAERSKK